MTTIAELIVSLTLNGRGFTQGVGEAVAAERNLEAASASVGRTTERSEAAARTAIRTRTNAQRQAARERTALERREAREREASERRTAQSRDAQLAGTTGAVKNLSGALLAMGAALFVGAGLKSFITDTITGAAGLGRLSANLGVSVEELDAWDRAARGTGAQAGEMSAQLKKANEEVAKVRLGQGVSEGMRIGFQFGLNDEDIFADSKTYVLAQSRVLADLIKTKGPEQAFVIGQQMGLSEGALNALRAGPAAFSALIEEQKKHAGATTESAKQAQELEKKFVDLKGEAEKTAISLTVKLWPTIKKLTEWLEANVEKFAAWVEKNSEKIGEFIDDVSNGISKVISFADDVAQAFGGWSNVLGGLVALKVGAWLIGITSAAVGLIGTTAGLLGVSSAMGAIALLGKGALVALAGVAGYAFGSEIYKVMGEQEKDFIGENIAKALAFFGNEEAKYVLESKRRQALGLPPPEMPKKPESAKKEETKKPIPANVQSITDQFIKFGWTPEQAAGITANLAHESTLNPAAEGDKNKAGAYQAYGLAQWHPDRQKDFSDKYGKSIKGSTVEEQVAFVNHELRFGKEQRAGKSLMRTKSASEAAAVVSNEYERPKDTAGEAAKRAVSAEQIMNQSRATNANAAARMPSGAALSPSVTNNTTNTAKTSTSSSEVHIGSIQVNAPQARDANGIAQNLRGALGGLDLGAQANYGMA